MSLNLFNFLIHFFPLEQFDILNLVSWQSCGHFIIISNINVEFFFIFILLTFFFYCKINVSCISQSTECLSYILKLWYQELLVIVCLVLQRNIIFFSLSTDSEDLAESPSPIVSEFKPIVTSTPLPYIVNQANNYLLEPLTGNTLLVYALPITMVCLNILILYKIIYGIPFEEPSVLLPMVEEVLVVDIISPLDKDVVS